MERCWARRWLSTPQNQQWGTLRMGRDVFHVSGLLHFDAVSQMVEMVLNQDARLADSLLHPLRELLAPLSIVVTLGQT